MDLKAAVLVFLTLPAVASAQALKPEEIYQKLLPSVVTLQVENAAGEKFVGTGFLALKDGVAVTAWHVVSDAVRVSAKFANDRPIEICGLIDKDEKHDLALIKVGQGGGQKVQLCASTPPVGARAYAIGAPKGFDFSITDGLVSQIQRVDGFSQYQISCPISGGNSGGPLVNELGEVIGVTSWTKTDAQNLSFATPAAFLASLDPALPVKAWGQFGSAPTAKVSPEKESANAVRAAGPDSDKAELDQLLTKYAGQEITLIVHDEGKEKSFTVTLPDQKSKIAEQK